MADEVAAGPSRPTPRAPRRPGAGRHWILAPETAMAVGAGRLNPVVLASSTSTCERRGGSVGCQARGGGRSPPGHDPWADYLSGDPWHGNDDVMRECQEEWCADFLTLQRSHWAVAETNAQTVQPEGHEMDKPSARRSSLASASTFSGGYLSGVSSAATLRPSTARSCDASQARGWQTGSSSRGSNPSCASPLRTRGSLFEAVALTVSPTTSRAASPVASPVADWRNLQSNLYGAPTPNMPPSGHLTSRSKDKKSWFTSSCERRQANSGG
mmetsp:Transcript_88799/g.176518  ORF Transcript_88799/g.176518 Transcript_88799/m.176518 type:complete len:270 (-) Transcript_88799:56-865(-)